MDHRARKILAQVNFSLILQFASDPETKEFVVPALREAVEKTKIPKSMIKSASFVIPDQPITALNNQKVPLKKLFDWYLSPQGCQTWLGNPPLHEEVFNAPTDDSEGGHPEKIRAENGLDFMTKFLCRASKLTEEAKARYKKAIQQWKSVAGNKTLSPDVATNAHKKMLDEAYHLSTTTDFLALVSLHYQKYLNEVTTAGFDVSAHRKISDPILEGNLPNNNSGGKYSTLSFFTIPPSMMNDFSDKFYASCNQLLCIANDEVLQKQYKNTGKPNYPLYTHRVYSGLRAPIPSWARKYVDELVARTLQNIDYSPDAAAWMLGFRDSPDSSAYCLSRSPRQWKEEIKRISVRAEVLWRKQENQGVRFTQIFEELALEYGYSEDNIRDWFYEKNERRKESRREKKKKK